MKGMMQAVVVEAPERVAIKEIPIPSIDPDEVLIQVKVCAVCGSDPMIVHGTYPRIRYPLVPGHEIGGVVMEVGSAVLNVAPGDRVTMESQKTCGKCVNCVQGLYTACLNYGNLQAGHKQIGFTVNGGYAQYVAVSERCVHPLPDNVGFDDAPIAQAAGVVLYGVKQAGGIRPGETVAILGAGLIGLISIQVARAYYAGRVLVSDSNPDRLQLGLALGAHQVFNQFETDIVAALREITRGVGADFVIEASGSPKAVGQAVELCRPGGRILLLGITKGPATINSSKIPMGNLTIYGSRGEGMWSMRDALAMLAQGKIQSTRLLTHRFPLREFPKALETAEKRLEGAIRVLVEP